MRIVYLLMSLSKKSITVLRFIFVGISLIATLPAPTLAANTVQLTADHFGNLGVTLGKLTAISDVPLLTAPAKVVIPPAHEFSVSAAQAGLITHLTASMGDSVHKGDILAQINSPDLLALQGRYLKTLSALSLATATYQRDKKLLKEGVIANRREQETLSVYNAAVLDVNEAKQLLAIAGMSAAAIQRLDQSHQLSSQIEVRAPISGVIIERMATVGTRVDMLAPLYRLANLEELWLDIAIPQEKIGSIKIGDTVLIENTPILAVIRLIGQSVQPENQSLLVRAVIQGGQNAVRVGQRVNIQIIQTNQVGLYKVPNTAVAQNEGKAFIFVHSATGFTVTPVEVISKQSEYSVIRGTLNEQDEIALKGAVALKANWLGLGSEE